jgi:hypothetical protein
MQLDRLSGPESSPAWQQAEAVAVNSQLSPPHQAKGVVGGPEGGVQHGVCRHRVLVLVARPARDAQPRGRSAAGLLKGLAVPSQKAGWVSA